MSKEEQLRDHLRSALAIAEELYLKRKDAEKARSLIGEVHRFALKTYIASKGRGIETTKLIEFLSPRCPAEQITDILDTACHLGWLWQNSETRLLIPRARTPQQQDEILAMWATVSGDPSK